MYQYKQKQAEKLKKKARYTCKTCKSVFNSSMIYTCSYIEKTTEKEKKRKRTYDENTNPKKKSFKMAVSGVTWGGWGAD